MRTKPLTPDSKKTVTIGPLLVPPAMALDLYRLSARHGESMAQVVRTFIERGLRAERAALARQSERAV